MKSGAVTVELFRFDPARDAKPFMQQCFVDLDTPISVMALLTQLHILDPAMACRTSQCYHGTCLSCLIRVNGRDIRGCEALVHPGDHLTIEPASRYKIIRDVVVDFSQPRDPGEG